MLLSLDGWSPGLVNGKGMIVSIFTSLNIVVGALTAISCCVTPCMKGLVQRLIETALLKQIPMEPPPYSDKMMILEEIGNEENEEEEDAYKIAP